MRFVYLSGKLTGKLKPYYYFIAWWHARKLWKQRDENGRHRYAVYSPHMNGLFQSKILTESEWLAADLEIINRCDELHLIPNWEKSKGARIERQYAIKRGIKIKHL